MRKLVSIFGRLSLFTALAFFGLPSGGAPTFVPGDQPFGDVPPLALTGFNLSTGTQRVFQVYFDGNSWAGDVSAYPVGTDGRTQLTNKLWSAASVFANKQACGFPATDPAGSDVNYFDTDRIIVTRSGATNIPFRWSAGGLSDAQKATINADISAGGMGDKIHKFIRGDRSNEKYQQILAGDGTVLSQCGVTPGTGIFRARAGILGDVLHSRPVFVGAPPADYTFDSYQSFKSANASRAERVYVGANDGMVHAFDAATGVETWAYIPSMLIGNLKNLSVDPYTHTYFVDGGVAAGDVNFGTTAAPDWRTVLVGGLGAGGKGLYALDITNVSAADETEAKAKIVWEITPASLGFADLGYTYGTPVIARLNTGQWAMIIGNGYLNGNTGHAVLYIIDIVTGTLIKALDTGSGSIASPNGLSSPTAIDTNFDGKVDRIYAGDIDGNLWKFDVSASSAASWTAPASAMFPTSGDLTAGITRKAIISAPDVAAHPISGYLVYFGTGRLLTASDAADASSQNYAYAIWDGAPPANTTFLNQTLTEKLYDTQRVRVSSGLPINWNNNTDPVGNPMRKGWRTALPAGENVIGTGFVRDARYQFTGVNATVVNTPPPNGENWLIELDYLTGGATDKPIFDLNADRLLDDNDRVFAADGTTRQAGPTGISVAVFMGKGLLSQPVLANVSAQLSTTLFNDNPYYAPADQPAVPSTPTERGVAGGHFDVDIYYAATGGLLCDYSTSGTKAFGTLMFTYSGNKTADTITVKVDGVTVASGNPGSKSAKNLAKWIKDNASSANWNFTNPSDGELKIEAKVAGTAWNGKQITITTGTGMTASDYTGENTSTAGGTEPGAGVQTTSSCKSKQHFHEYDEIYNVTGVNFLAPSSGTLDIKNAITNTSTNFKVLVHNQYLSPAVTISVGGAPYIDARNYTTSATLDLGTLPTYNRNNIGTLAINMPVDAFSLKDWWGDGVVRSGLHPTQTGCVKDSSGSPLGGHQHYEAIDPPANGTDGPGTLSVNGARHNGALVVQLVKDTTPNSAIEMNVAGRPEYGWRVKGSDASNSDYETYVLAEWTVFWHHPNGKCYNAAGWTMVPPPDTSPPDSSKFKTPDAGSSDPGFGTARVTVVSTTTTTTTSDGTTTTIVITNYSDGSQLVVTTVTSGGVTTASSQFIPASAAIGGATPPPPPSVGQAVSSPNTITGYQQTRNSGKLGRVTWRELFAQ